MQVLHISYKQKHTNAPHIFSMIYANETGHIGKKDLKLNHIEITMKLNFKKIKYNFIIVNFVPFFDILK